MKSYAKTTFARATALAVLLSIALGTTFTNTTYSSTSDNTGISTGTNAIVKGQGAIAAGKNSIAIGTNAVATGDNLSLEELQKVLKENKERLEQIALLQSKIATAEHELNRNSNSVTKIKETLERKQAIKAEIAVLQEQEQEAEEAFRPFSSIYESTQKIMQERIKVLTKKEIIDELINQVNHPAEKDVWNKKMDKLATKLRREFENGFIVPNIDEFHYSRYLSDYLQALENNKSAQSIINVIEGNPSNAKPNDDYILDNIANNNVSYKSKQSLAEGVSLRTLLTHTNDNGENTIGVYVCTKGNRLLIDSPVNIDGLKYDDVFSKISLTDKNVVLPSLTLTEESYKKWSAFVDKNRTDVANWFKSQDNLFIDLDHYPGYEANKLIEKIHGRFDIQQLILKSIYLRSEYEASKDKKYLDEQTIINKQIQAAYQYWQAIDAKGEVLSKYHAWCSDNIKDLSSVIKNSSILREFKESVLGNKERYVYELRQALETVQSKIASLNNENKQLELTSDETELAAQAERLKAKLDEDKTIVEKVIKDLELNNLGDIGTNAIAIGTNAITTGKNAIGIGTSSIVTGENAVAIGFSNKLSGTTSLTLGCQNTVSSDNTITIGNDNFASSDSTLTIGNKSSILKNSKNAIAIGNNIIIGANATAYPDAIVLGNSSAPQTASIVQDMILGGKNYTFAGANPFSTLSVGAPGKERQVVNVAAGQISISSTDAINGSQLFATNQAVESHANDLTSIKKQLTKIEAGKNLHTQTSENKDAVSVDNNNGNTTKIGLNDDISLGGDETKIELKGTKGTIAVGKGESGVSIDGTKAQTKVGSITTDGKKGNINGLSNKTWNPDNFVSGRAATEDQLKAAMVNDKNAVQYDGKNKDIITLAGKNGTKLDNIQDGDITPESQNAVNGRQIYGLRKEIEEKSIIYDSSKQDSITFKGQDGTKLSNIQDGAVTPESKDAINGRQLYHAQSALESRIDNIRDKMGKVGAGAAALAALHPLDQNPDQKWNIAAGTGSYGGNTALALGMFFKPKPNVQFSLSSSVGNGENMYNFGVSIALDRVPQRRNLQKDVSAMENRVQELEEIVFRLMQKSRAN